MPGKKKPEKASPSPFLTFANLYSRGEEGGPLTPVLLLFAKMRKNPKAALSATNSSDEVLGRQKTNV